MVNVAIKAIFYMLLVFFLSEVVISQLPPNEEIDDDGNSNLKRSKRQRWYPMAFRRRRIQINHGSEFDEYDMGPTFQMDYGDEPADDYYIDPEFHDRHKPCLGSGGRCWHDRECCSGKCCDKGIVGKRRSCCGEY